MSRRRPGLRIAIVILAALALGIAGPVHAAHHHANDALHATCTVCHLNSPACQPLFEPCAGMALEPILTLAACATSEFHSTPTTVAPTRAPPSLLALGS